jgi:mannose-1-phosphate guanylyltransferase
MKALLLAAGLGTRLRPITEKIPKCLVPINGVPLLDIWLEKLSNIGIEEFLINTHYLHQDVENFISKNKYKKKIKTTFEEKLLGTAGTLIKNKDFFESL